LQKFGVVRDHTLIEIGGGRGFLTWALHRAGYRIDLLEPNALWNTGTGYLRSREDAEGIEIFNDHLAWHAKPLYYDVFITKNCIHHFQNIGMVAASLRQKLSAGGKWFAFRKQFADTPKELGEALAIHPHCQRFCTCEWFYRLDALLVRSPVKTVDAFWQEVQRNRFEKAGAGVYTRPQVMIFTKI
jgi:hypothetical protein